MNKCNWCVWGKNQEHKIMFLKNIPFNKTTPLCNSILRPSSPWIVSPISGTANIQPWKYTQPVQPTSALRAKVKYTGVVNWFQN
jgi:hypothetical protein